MLNEASLRMARVGLALIVTLGLVVYLATLPGERISAQES